MEVILLKDVEKLGKRGEVVSVRGGFGRNYLLPQALAIRATKENRASAELEKKRIAVRQAKEKHSVEELAQKLTAAPIRIPMKVGENDKLFGSVTSQDLVQALKQLGFSVDKKSFRLDEPIKSLGRHSVNIQLESDVKAILQVEVVKK